MTQKNEDRKLTGLHFHLGVQIGLDIICRAALHVPEPERRAMIWLANYSRLQRISADQTAELLGISRRDVRAALTDPGEDRTRFVAAVQVLRERFEAAIPPLVETSVSRQARAAVRFADRHCSIVECVGPSRMGKTVTLKEEWYRRLDRAIYVHCPTGHSQRELHDDIAKALGIAVDSTRGGHAVRPKIESCFAPGLISLIIFDEAHRLWPHDPRECQPKRIEYIRTLHRDGEGASVLVAATPQFSAGLLAAMTNNPRWSPDQWYGRRVPFYTADTMSVEELTQIARHHAPEFSGEMIDLLVEQALACEGFAGLIANTILLARDNAEDARVPLDLELLTEATAQMVRGTRLEQMAQQQAAIPTTPKRRRAPRAALMPVARLNGAAHPPAAPVFTGAHTVRV